MIVVSVVIRLSVRLAPAVIVAALVATQLHPVVPATVVAANR